MEITKKLDEERLEVTTESKRIMTKTALLEQKAQLQGYMDEVNSKLAEFEK